MHDLVRDLNRLHRERPPLYRHDFEPEGFEWLECNDADWSRLSYLRKAGGQSLVVALNFTPVAQGEYRIGVPEPGDYRVIFNSDSEYYGGSNMGAADTLASEGHPCMGREHSLTVPLPALAGIILERV